MREIKSKKLQGLLQVLILIKFEEDGFEKTYVPQYLRGYSDQDLLVLSGLASEGILAMFDRVALNLGKSYMLPRPLKRAGQPYGKAPYYLASFQKEFSTKSLPLGYSCLRHGIKDYCQVLIEMMGEEKYMMMMMMTTMVMMVATNLPS
ncbi:uncharacterized protein LOC111332362 [Stylophora pistillata]|uniref:uncharacterized protein LOC111332362 n=1 Tax=Stylophora pistillata TaxID=50429 RepID=UPI000C051335|nr:uncharacterized protein LOC111332362 [Stylophora pistillata]